MDSTFRAWREHSEDFEAERLEVLKEARGLPAQTTHKMYRFGPAHYKIDGVEVTEAEFKERLNAALKRGGQG